MFLCGGGDGMNWLLISSTNLSIIGIEGAKLAEYV